MNIGDLSTMKMCGKDVQGCDARPIDQRHQGYLNVVEYFRSKPLEHNTFGFRGKRLTGLLGSYRVAYSYAIEWDSSLRAHRRYCLDSRDGENEHQIVCEVQVRDLPTSSCCIRDVVGD